MGKTDKEKQGNKTVPICACGAVIREQGATRCLVCKGLAMVAKHKAKAKAKASQPEFPMEVQEHADKLYEITMEWLEEHVDADMIHDVIRKLMGKLVMELPTRTVEVKPVASVTGQTNGDVTKYTVK